MKSAKRRKTRRSAHKTRASAYREPPKAGPKDIPFTNLETPDASSNMDELALWLSAVDHTYAWALESPPAEIGMVERTFAIAALGAVIEVLAFRAPSEMLRILLKALMDVQEGGHPAMLRSVSATRNRPTSSGNIQAIKGAVAGLARQKQDEGMRREAAASWIAGNIAPELEGKLSKKRITGRTVREWLDRYGGKHPPDEAGGKAFKVWSRPWHEELSATWVRQLTLKWALIIPSPPKT